MKQFIVEITADLPPLRRFSYTVQATDHFRAVKFARAAFKSEPTIKRKRLGILSFRVIPAGKVENTVEETKKENPHVFDEIDRMEAQRVHAKHNEVLSNFFAKIA